jgi:hypothetical protein
MLPHQRAGITNIKWEEIAMKITSAWQSDIPNPDEEFLKAEFEAETESLERSATAESDYSKRKQARLEPLVRATNLSGRDIDRMNKQAKLASRSSLQRAVSQVIDPSLDLEALHTKDLEVAKSVAKDLTPGGNPYWQGFVWSPSYGGWWHNWNGEGEEVPYTVVNVSSERIDSRTQAYGEGWWDGDYSRAHGYLAFRFNPPSWGHLHIHVYPWFHGYYSLYSNDEWYNSEYAKAVVDSWIDIHQNFWRSRQYVRRFTLAGDELHPTRWGRIDAQYSQSYYTNVGAGDTVTIRVGAHLYSYARAGGSHSVLNFIDGSGNYVLVPYVYWYLHR